MLFELLSSDFPGMMHQPYAPFQMLMRTVNHWVYTTTAKSQVALWQCRFNDKSLLVQRSPAENI